jgi:hypothetical protein
MGQYLTRVSRGLDPYLLLAEKVQRQRLRMHQMELNGGISLQS